MGVFEKPVLVLFIILWFTPLKAQYTDTLSTTNRRDNSYRSYRRELPSQKGNFTYKSYVVPAFMIVYGITTLKSDALQDINEGLQEEIWSDIPHKILRIDDFLQFAPAAAVYGLNLSGIHGKNNLRDRSLVYLLSNVMLNTSVGVLKRVTKQERPDGSSNQSFPSGHTAEAFASAEFLRQEYKDVSPWYGIAGYATATATGLLRIYNNRHWLSDVIEGAGIGIVSARLAYWMYPAISRTFFKKGNAHTMVMPYYQNGGGGLSMAHNFSK